MASQTEALMPRHPKAAMEALVEESLLMALGPRRLALDALVVETGLQAQEHLKALQAVGGLWARDCGHWPRCFCWLLRRPPIGRLNVHWRPH